MIAFGLFLLAGELVQTVPTWNGPLHPLPAPRAEAEHTIYCGSRSGRVRYTNYYRANEGGRNRNVILNRFQSSPHAIRAGDRRRVEALFAAFGRIERVSGRCWEREILIDVHGYELAGYEASRAGGPPAPLVMRTITLRANGAVDLSR